MEYANLIMQIKEISTQIEIFDKAIDRYNMMKQMNIESADAALFKKAFQAKIVKKAEKEKCEAEYNRLYELIREAGKSVVRVNGKIYYGVKVFMDDMIYMPEDVFSHVIIRKFNDNIVIRGYDE
jgi:N-dimethylarginine dimethylaminohydrolase